MDEQLGNEMQLIFDSMPLGAGIPLLNRGEVLLDLQGTVEIMETVSGAKEEVPRDAVVGIIAARLRELGPLDLVVPGRSAE